MGQRTEIYAQLHLHRNRISRTESTAPPTPVRKGPSIARPEQDGTRPVGRGTTENFRHLFRARTRLLRARADFGIDGARLYGPPRAIRINLIGERYARDSPVPLRRQSSSRRRLGPSFRAVSDIEVILLLLLIFVEDV